MKKYVLIFALLAGISTVSCSDDDDDSVAQPVSPFGEQGTFAAEVVADGFSSPWEIVWGPDGYLWLTERSGRRITRVNPNDGTKAVAVTINDAHQTGGQDGVLGLALHPELLANTDNDFVFVAMTYSTASGPRTKIRRYTYDPASGLLGAPLDILMGMPASNDHNSGRLVIGRDLKIYYTIGDQGNNQLGNKCRPNLAQQLPTAVEITQKNYISYQGKSLRFNLDGSIPADNPVLNGVQSHIFTYGHRNPQGLAFGPNGLLYSSEHGPKTDDEINVLNAGQNYGWPHVLGYLDDQAYVYGNWSAAANKSCPITPYSDIAIPSVVPITTESSWGQPFTPPMQTLFTVQTGYNFQDPACNDPSTTHMCWPTVALSGMDVYSSTEIPGWNTSILVASLKQGAVYRLLLNGDGQSAAAPIPIFDTLNRYRDIAISADNRTIFVITDSSGLSVDPNGGATTQLENPGAILKFEYQR